MSVQLNAEECNIRRFLTEPAAEHGPRFRFTVASDSSTVTRPRARPPARPHARTHVHVCFISVIRVLGPVVHRRTER